MKQFFTTKIPFYALIIILLVVFSGIAIFYMKFREVIYDYNLYLTQANISSLGKLQYGVWPTLSNQIFFDQIKDGFIKNKATFINADLSGMKLRYYEKGILLNEFPILSKGRPGSWWETPSGLYKITTKEENHFSSFGQVYQPYSMAFQGNFFIHGWPYYPDNTLVPTGYSGGCIRLTTEDAKKIYDLVKIGTPVLIYENSLSNDSSNYQFKIPDISAQSYLAADLKNNFVFLQKNSGAKMPIASITKLVTAMVAAEYINLDNNILIDNSMIVPTSKPRLAPNKPVPAFQLLFPLLMESSNEAAMAFSEFLGNDRFVTLMNDKAGSLGLNDTIFADASGSSDGNISTAEDLFNLVKNIYANRSFILKISAGKTKDSSYESSKFKDLENFNGFSNDPDFIGGKVGETTSAGKTIISLFNINFGNETRPVAIIALNSTDNFSDVQAIKNYIIQNYTFNNKK